MDTKLKYWIGDKAFYKMFLAILLPIVIQNAFTNLAGLLDNIMVGQIGTEPMSGVAISNQVINVFNLCIFGATAGAGIFGAQFAGNRDFEGVRQIARFKLVVCAGLLAVALIVFLLLSEPLIRLFLTDSGEGDLEATLQYGKQYLMVMLLGLPAFVVSQCYASTLRETGETVLPMKSGIVSVLVNLILNYILIFGKFGLPAMGVVGAAVATVICRYVEMAFLLHIVHKHTDRYIFAQELYHGFSITPTLAKTVTIKGFPLLFNEFFWSLGMTMLLQCYSTRGLEAVAAINISNTVNNMFTVITLGIGSAISIIIGQMLGAGQKKEARLADTRLLVLSVLICAGVGGMMVLVAPLFPTLYNTTDHVRELASNLLRVCGVMLPLIAFLHGSYFTLRAGGNTIITLIFDSGFLWVMAIPMAFYLSRFTELPLLTVYILVQAAELLKAVLGFFMLKSDTWLNRIVAVEEES